ncbi:26305_t:CDS:2, partial [Dentiscutata erythropus]
MENFVKSLKLNHKLRYQNLDFVHTEQNFVRDEPLLESFTEIQVCQSDPEGENTWNFVSLNSDKNENNNPEIIKILIPIFKVQCAKPQDELLETTKELFISMVVWIGGYLIIEKYPKDLLELSKLQMCINWAISNVRKKQDISFEDFNITLNIKNSKDDVINNMKELSDYIEQLYNFKYISVIAYEKVISLSGHDKDHKILIPKISKHKIIGMDKWLQGNILLNIPRWIKNYKLNHGLVISYNGVTISEKPAIGISISSIKKVQKTKKEYFGEVESSSSTDIQYRYRIVNEQLEFTLSNKFELTAKFEEAVEDALNSESAYDELTKIFSKYGHVICQKFTIGKIINILSNKDGLTNEDNSKEPIERSTHVNVSDAWSKYVFEHPDLWCVVDRYGMIPITKFLKKEMQQKIKSIEEENRRIIDCSITIFKPKKERNIMLNLKFAETECDMAQYVAETVIKNKPDNGVRINGRRRSIFERFLNITHPNKEYYLENNAFECIIKDEQNEAKHVENYLEPVLLEIILDDKLNSTFLAFLSMS